MLTVIFGREGCPFCVRAKDVAEQLANDRDDFKYRYIDIIKEGISKEDLIPEEIEKEGEDLEPMP